MFYIYSKEKKAKVKFTINLTEEEVKQFMGNDLFLDYPELDKNDYIIVKDEVFRYPTYDTVSNSIREMTREELIHEEIEVQLEPGEVVRDKKIVKIPKPNKNEKYLTWNRETAVWEYDSKREKDDYFNLVDQLKNEALEYGFDYKNHRQRLRTKDLIYMEISIKSLEIGKKKTKKDLKSTWYFQDGFGMPMSVEDLEDMMFSGTMFIQSIFNTESFFKTEIEPKELTITEFKNKVNELHKLVMKAVGGKE
ncbi:penicillin-binding protein [Fusobacterium pseudoperiodonticum]|uniref:penicillin-binding protein n=1 Tax=Fusobacterium pseudoperiodonticum TaxID=2663009 RepID=UPI000C1C3817|nr:penicillin-binding protein [Fusobacterium pseudoperiodonticum]ATV63242.1 penicillin-binding protein [Fusobacterium pseudoperiodonticum]